MSSYHKYLGKSNSPMPKAHLDILEKGDEIAEHVVLKRNDINQLFKNGYLTCENGFHQFNDGSTYVAVLTQMPNVTIEMIDWWFWWHAAETVRYQIWYPEMHFDISADFQGHYDNETKSYRERLHLSQHLVTEDIGVGQDKILIDFIPPTQFGFKKEQLSNEVTIICARVGSPNKGVWGTEMCHFVRKVKKGVEMRSRFWIGNKIERMKGLTFLNGLLNQPFVKRILLPKALGSKMFHHCSQEYHNLAALLPQLYQEEHLKH